MLKAVTPILPILLAETEVDEFCAQRLKSIAAFGIIAERQDLNRNQAVKGDKFPM